ncbi:SUN domain-containing protein 3-like, partial [Scomber japonicus]|uniref:SUN domain-containing protein 3-like n=1 Tax=Scomber japonicus TaxID=13676 RepID=UPI002306AA98
HPVTITHVTLGHISSRQSIAGFTYSAPREFSVYGIQTVNGGTTRLGTFVYDPNGESLQTFKLPGHTMGVFRFVKLQIESNWGHPEYTCVYNFRVHGTIPMMRVAAFHSAPLLVSSSHEDMKKKNAHFAPPLGVQVC